MEETSRVIRPDDRLQDGMFVAIRRLAAEFWRCRDHVGASFRQDFRSLYTGTVFGVVWNIILIVASTTFALTVTLFIIAMRLSRTFNKQVRNASFFRPITRSRSHTLRAALNLPADDGYEEIPRTLNAY